MSANPEPAQRISGLRNIGIIAHIDAGKTTFSERILYYSDVIHRMGEVHEGAATMDFMPEEQERGITITSACITCPWNECVINLVDTPGHVDFTVEVERCLRVLDAAVGVFCAVSGVEPQSETVWRQADGFGIPRLAVVNKMDRPGASFASVLRSMRERLGANPLALTIPLGEGEDFRAVVDLVRMEKLVFDARTQGKTISRHPLDASEADLAAPWREALLDALTLEDDHLLDLCLGGGDPAPELLDAALRKAILAGRVVPAFAASALRNIGVQPVLDAVCRYLPSPLDRPPARAALADTGEETLVRADPSARTCALVFKVVFNSGRKLHFLRLYSGTLREGDVLANSAGGRTDVAARIFRLRADRRENLQAAFAGDIVAVQGMKEARTGDTLAAPGPPLLLEKLRSWRPVISLAFEPRNSAEGEKLDLALQAFCAEDPTLLVETNEATGQRLVSGMGELHLEILADRMRREWNISPRIGNPQVLRRETIAGAASGVGEFDRYLGEVPHYGYVELQVKPRERSLGTVSAVAPDAAPEWPRALAGAALQGVRDACCSGPSGFEVDDADILITRLGRKANGLCTSPGLHMAAQQALRQALEKAVPIILEPVMRVDITVPEVFLGAVISLLGARFAKVEEIGGQAGGRQIRALAPMRGLFGFATALRSASQGRAGLIMQFLRFDRV
ncbi:MAG: GTP-binding protein [Desulfovibrio sp.]|jgi:elongation factor G|nr:GTP-binding protein [Desulfovibrio sp.]